MKNLLELLYIKNPSLKNNPISKHQLCLVHQRYINKVLPYYFFEVYKKTKANLKVGFYHFKSLAYPKTLIPLPKWKGLHIDMICRINFLQLGLSINEMLRLIIDILNLE